MAGSYQSRRAGGVRLWRDGKSGIGESRHRFDSVKQESLIAKSGIPVLQGGEDVNSFPPSTGSGHRVETFDSAPASSTVLHDGYGDDSRQGRNPMRVEWDSGH